MDIGTIDYWSTREISSYHRAAGWAKVVAAFLTVGAVVLTSDLVVLVAYYLVLVTLVTWARLPTREVVLLGLYPAIFVLLFVLSQWGGNLGRAAVLMLRALDSALAMILLITTTPYHEVFAVFRAFLPAVVADGLLLTYRSLFILLDLAGDLWTALRLRGGLSRRRLLKNLANISYGLGLLAIRAIELGQRQYDVLRIRGYTGRMIAGAAIDWPTRHELLPLGCGCILLVVGIASRLTGPGLAGYNGYVLLLALLLLGGSVIRRSKSTPGPATTRGT